MVPDAVGDLAIPRRQSERPGTAAPFPLHPRAAPAAATCSPMSDGDCSPEYLRHLVRVHSHQALTAPFGPPDRGAPDSGRLNGRSRRSRTPPDLAPPRTV